MEIIKTLKKVEKKVRSKVRSHQNKVKRDAATLRKMRSRSIPTVKRVAAEYGATVEVLDTSAYVSKTIDGSERGAHIPYGIHPMEIRRLLDKAFIKSTLLSKVRAGVKTVGHAKKEWGKVKKELKDAGFAGGGMWGDPSKMWNK
jgi:hypothetical protein